MPPHHADPVAQPTIDLRPRLDVKPLTVSRPGPTATAAGSTASTLPSAADGSAASASCCCDASAPDSHDICAHQLVAHLQAPTELLLIDARPFCQFSAGHIRDAIHVTCSVILLKRLEKRTLSVVDLVSESYRCKYRSSHANAVAIIYDDGSQSLAASHLAGLFHAVQREAAAAYFLRGGFTAFKNLFPHLVSAETTLPRQLVIQKPTLSIAAARSPCTAAAAQLKQGPTRILPHLYLGSRQDAEDCAALRAHNIRYILNVTPDCPNFHCSDDSFVYKQIPVLDSWHQDISSYFDEAAAFIDEARMHNTAVLVHCMAGISRSATIVIAYLMKRQNMTLNDAMAFVKGLRSMISPNLDFMGHLLMYERKLSEDSMCSASFTHAPASSGVAISAPN